MQMNFRLPIETLAVWRKDEQKRMMSSSGGLAAAISENWIRKGGVVYGAAFINPFSVSHIRCSTLEDVDKLRGSKYVQSSMNGVVKLIEKDVQDGVDVLFFGTPCQVAGIVNRFDNKVRTVDVLCHGTPSMSTFKESLPKDLLNQEFDKIEFRSNNKYIFSLTSKGHVVLKRPLSNDLYMLGFFTALFNRECCYKCKFARKERVSDISIGDFWNVNKSQVNTDIEKGLSLALINTKEGKNIIEMIDPEIEYVERPLQEAEEGNQPLCRASKKTFRSKIFNFLHPKVGFKWAVRLSIPEIVIKRMIVR